VNAIAISFLQRRKLHGMMAALSGRRCGDNLLLGSFMSRGAWLRSESAVEILRAILGVRRRPSFLRTKVAPVLEKMSPDLPNENGLLSMNAPR
jgi:hypothetical protein